MVPFWDESTSGAFGIYPAYGPIATSDTFSLSGTTYERQDDKITVRRNSAQELHRAKWIIPTLDAALALYPAPAPIPRRTLDSMLTILTKILDDQTPPPSVVPTWEGGLQVEWHRNGVDLEIEVNSSGRVVEYFFASSEEEHEGMAWEEIERLTEYARVIV